MRRRDFLALAGLTLTGCAVDAPPPLPAGELSGGDFALGHRLALNDFPPPVATHEIPILIIGAGIAGLSAAWRLRRAGLLNQFHLLELETEPGGNSRCGENSISRYPLGAHYLPLPNLEARAVRALLSDSGVLKGNPQAEAPEYDERYLCHAPQERLYRLGAWQEGVIPHLGVSSAERKQQERFLARMESFRTAHDQQGRRAFALPAVFSSDAPEWAALDRLTMHDWMRQEGFDAPSLDWLVNYACRDDYGTDFRQVSAWAGIHYFSCRTGKGAQGASDTVLTAPEGNGWLVRSLLEQIGHPSASHETSPVLSAGSAVYALSQNAQECQVDVWQAARQQSVRYRAKHIIWAAPLHLLPRLARNLPAELAAAIAPVSYAPWLVANLSLSAPPASGAGAPLAWDNVLQKSPALGYVVATHQKIRRAPGPTVLTYYHALSEYDPATARTLLLNTTQTDWAATILADLSHAHRDIRTLVTRLDIFRHGHAMARPLPGFRDNERRHRLAKGWGRVRLAHADISGFSVFEEANYWGVRAAEEILTAHYGKHLQERLA
ncbi:amino oxidase [Betaproteobacteria bacterium]|nr:amino oxidase [Betaproteobacteria bacterium]GHU46832.1 amino oxidase [Betaproteobacteria bacterium]